MSNQSETPTPKIAPKRGRGRPARITAQVIIDKTMELLATRNAEETSMALVASSLNAPTMSLYNYFPNYSALLDAVSDHAFSLFRFPHSRTPKTPSEILLAWLWALQRHCERHPIAFKIMSIEGHASNAWNKARLPVLEVMRNMGLQDQDLAFALCWFTNQAIGLMHAENFSYPARLNLSLASTETPTETDAEFTKLYPYMKRVKRQQVLDFGFTAIVNALTNWSQGAK